MPSVCFVLSVVSDLCTWVIRFMFFRVKDLIMYDVGGFPNAFVDV